MYSFPAMTPCNRFSGNESAHARLRAARARDSRTPNPDPSPSRPAEPRSWLREPLRGRLAAPGARIARILPIAAMIPQRMARTLVART